MFELKITRAYKANFHYIRYTNGKCIHTHTHAVSPIVDDHRCYNRKLFNITKKPPKKRVQNTSGTQLNLKPEKQPKYNLFFFSGHVFCVGTTGKNQNAILHYESF